MAVYTVKREEDAWALLTAWSEGKEIEGVRFKGWPVLSIRIRGDDYQSSLNSGQMEALVELRRVFGRAYSAMAHGAYDMRRLRSDEEEQLEFSTRVRQGSSILDTDLSPLVQGFAHAIAANPTLSIVMATVLSLTFVSRPVIVKYFEERSKRLDVEERKRLLDLSLSRDEAAKYRLFERSRKELAEFQPQLNQVLPDAREAFWRFASSSVDADTMNVAGLELSQDDLEILAERRGRRPSDIKRITDTFTIKYIRKKESGFSVGLESRRMTMGVTFRRPQLTETRFKRLTGYFAREQKIKATVDLKVADKSVISGRLISFSAEE